MGAFLSVLQDLDLALTRNDNILTHHPTPKSFMQHHRFQRK